MTQYPPLSTFSHSQGQRLNLPGTVQISLHYPPDNLEYLQVHVKLPLHPCPISSHNSQEDDKKLHKMADDLKKKKTHKMAEGYFPQDIRLVCFFKQSCYNLFLSGKRNVTIILVRRWNPQWLTSQQQGKGHRALGKLKWPTPHTTETESQHVLRRRRGNRKEQIYLEWRKWWLSPLYMAWKYERKWRSGSIPGK